MSTKGCNCKKSRCEKNYCECRSSQLPCGTNCKCLLCKNTVDTYLKAMHLDSVDSLVNIWQEQHLNHSPITVKHARAVARSNNAPVPSEVVPVKSHCSAYSENTSKDTLIDAAVQCLLNTAQHDEKCGTSEVDSERNIINEFANLMETMVKGFSSNEDGDTEDGDN